MTSLQRPVLTRSQTQAPIDSEEDDTISDMPELEPIRPRFDGSKSSSTAETLVDFLQSFNWNTTKLKDIPGIGPASVGKLQEHNIHRVQQLVGAYMGFMEPNATSAEINNDFYDWFKEVSPNANAHTVTFAIAHLAEKFGMVVYED
jgi:hypothetical protein